MRTWKALKSLTFSKQRDIVMRKGQITKLQQARLPFLRASCEGREFSYPALLSRIASYWPDPGKNGWVSCNFTRDCMLCNARLG